MSSVPCGADMQEDGRAYVMLVSEAPVCPWAIIVRETPTDWLRKGAHLWVMVCKPRTLRARLFIFICSMFHVESIIQGRV